MKTLIKKGTIVRRKSGIDNSGIPGGELFDVVYRIPRSRSIDSKKQIVVFGEKSAANTFEYYWEDEEDYIPVQLKNVSKEYKKDIQFKLNKLTSKKSKGKLRMKNLKKIQGNIITQGNLLKKNFVYNELLIDGEDHLDYKALILNVDLKKKTIFALLLSELGKVSKKQVQKVMNFSHKDYVDGVMYNEEDENVCRLYDEIVAYTIEKDGTVTTCQGAKLTFSNPKEFNVQSNKSISKKSKGNSTMKTTNNSTRKSSRTASKKTLKSSIPSFVISVAKDLTSKVKSLNKKVDSKGLTTGVAIKNGNTTVLTLNKVNSKGIGQLCFNKLSVKEVKPLTSLKVEKIQDQYTVIKNFSVEDFGKVKNAVKKALTISNSEK